MILPLSKAVIVGFSYGSKCNARKLRSFCDLSKKGLYNRLQIWSYGLVNRVVVYVREVWISCVCDLFVPACLIQLLNLGFWKCECESFRNVNEYMFISNLFKVSRFL